MHGLRSPRTRGWSRLGAHRRGAGGAFPAYAGVVPGRGGWGRSGGRVPRVRGGGPCWATKIAAWTSRSPRTRGWSQVAAVDAGAVDAFPAYAGVVRRRGPTPTVGRRVPRVRGGGPLLGLLGLVAVARSPRTRGWSRRAGRAAGCAAAFPAYAGVVPARAMVRRAIRRVPRVRGGGPLEIGTAGQTSKRSPRTQGWSPIKELVERSVKAFPAYAGVVPRPTGSSAERSRVPRVRGGGPQT